MVEWMGMSRYIVPELLLIFWGLLISSYLIWLLIVIGRSIRRLELLVSEISPCRPTSITLHQLQGGSPMPITGIKAGATGTFGLSPTPAGSQFPSGTTFTWKSDNPLTTLTPSSDGTSVAVATTSSDPATSFNLTCTSSFTPPGAGSPLSATVNVPILPNVPPPPPPPTPTGMDISQLS